MWQYEKQQELVAAASRGDVKRVSSLLEIPGINVNGFDPLERLETPRFLIRETTPPLLTACGAGQLEVVRVLLKHKDIRVNFVYKGETPLSAAAKHGYTELMKVLLEHGAVVDYVGDNPPRHSVRVWTALMVAARSGQYEAAVLLLQNRAKVDGIQSEFSGVTPLLLAAGKGHANLVQLFLDNDVIVQGGRGIPPLAAACRGGHTECVMLLLNNGVDIKSIAKEDLPQLLFAACRAGQLEVVRILLKHKGIRVNFVCEGETPLSAAAGHGCIEIMKLLLEHGAAVDCIGDNPYRVRTALMFAADNDQYKAAVLLLQNGAKVDGIMSLFVDDTPLSLAAGNGNASLVQLLLDNGASVHGGGLIFKSPLEAAIRGGHTECVKLLIKSVTDIKSITKEYLPQLLLAACQAGQLEVMSVLLKRKDILVNFVYYGETPLSAAAKHGYTEIMKLLLEHGAGVDYVGDDPASSVRTALLIATLNNQCAAAVLLLQNGAKVDGIEPQFKRDTPISIAAGKGHANLVQLLLDNGANVQGGGGSYSTSPLAAAIRGGRTKCVMLLVKNGANVNEGDLPPLLAACQAGQLKLVRVLLKHKNNIRVNFVYEWETPLSAAAKHGYTEIMKLLLEHGAGVDYVGDDPDGGVWTALTAATDNGQYEAAVILLQNGAKVDGVQSGAAGGTPVLIAAREGHANLVQLLLDNGASVHVRGKSYPFTFPLIAACIRGHTECARLLIQHGSQVDEDDGAPLSCAVENGHTECTRLLLENGADVNIISDALKYSPLMHASIYGHIDVVQLLLEHGAKVNASNDEGDTALSLARSEKHVEIAELLLKHGAKEEDSELDSEVKSTEESVEDRKEEREEDGVEDRKEGRGDDHVENSEKEADAEDLGDPSEAEHLAAVDRAIKEKGTLDHTLAHGVFSGPARSGKSSLMTRLVGEKASSISPSTGVAEQAIQVGVRKSYSIALGVLDSIWFKLLYDEEAIRLMTLASHIIPIQPAASLTDRTPSPPTTLLQSDPENELPTVTLPTPLLHGEPEDMASAKSVTVSLPAGYVAPMGVFKAAIRGRGLEGLRRHFENSWSLYLTDTGGQIEFQEMIPLLVSGPSVFFITFRLDQDLHQRFTIEYHLPDGGRSEPYQSTLTVVEAILQTLASIASMGTFVYKGPQMESTPLKPKVIIVGTHKDMLNPATADSDIKKIDQYLQGVIKSTSHYQDLVEFATKYQMIYTVNNLSEDDSDFNKIRSGVERVVCRPKFKMSFPSHWLIFSLVLRQEMIKDSIISFEQCSAIAQDCGITDHEELGHALWFLHTKIGLIRHFPTPGLRDLVIRHPQILFDMVTKLIVNTFTFENLGKPLSTEFEKKGIFTLEDFKQIYRASTPLLPPEKLLQLLEHLRIVAPFEEESQRKYFLPCILAHSEACEEASSPQSSDIPPLLITFECGYCPKGLYGALMQCLLTNIVGSKFKWELMTDQIFRDQVTFDVSPYDTVTLKIHPKYLEIIHSCTTELNRAEKVEDVCNKVRLSVEEGIRKVSSNMKLTSYANHSLSFYCGHPDCTPKEGHPATEILKCEDGSLCNLRCKKSGKTLRSCLPAGYCVWFGREKEETLAASQRDLTVTRPKRALAATPHPDHTTTTVGDEQPTEDQDLASSHPKKRKIECQHAEVSKHSSTQPMETQTQIPAVNDTFRLLLPLTHVFHSQNPNTGQIRTCRFRPASDRSEDTSATKCWQLESIPSELELDGRGVGIAIIDAGVNLGHTAFQLLVQPVKGLNFVEGAPSDAWQTQPSSHGTMVAFVAAGRRFSTVVNSQTGRQVVLTVNSGVAPNSLLVICSVGQSYSMNAVSCALERLIAEKQEGKLELDIVCMSFGERNDPRDENQQKITGLIKQLRDLNVIMVAAAGNYGEYCDGVLFPACLSDVISVGALNHTGYKSETNFPTDIDVYAPGESITHPAFDSAGGVERSSGSSCAAPAIAGLVALTVQFSRSKYATPQERELCKKLDNVKTILKREMKKKGNAVLLDPRDYFQRKLDQYKITELELEVERLKNAQ